MIEMTTGENDSDARTEIRTPYARLTSLLELSKDDRPGSGQWEDEVRLAFRTYLAESAQPHLIAPLLQRLPSAVAMEELHAAWKDLQTNIKEKLLGAFKQGPALLPVSVGLAVELASSEIRESLRVAESALQAIKRSRPPALRLWVDGGGLTDMSSLVLRLRDRLPSLTDPLATLISAAEGVVSSGAKQTRTKVAAFAREATTLIESAGLHQDQQAILSSRLKVLADEAEQQPSTKGKESRTPRTPPRHGQEVSVPAATETPLQTPPSVRASSGTDGNLLSPRRVIDTLRQMLGFVEELETRRTQQKEFEEIREARSALDCEVLRLSKQLKDEEQIMSALRIRVSELEDRIEVVTGERDSTSRRCADLQANVSAAESRCAQLESEHVRLLDELPQQRLAEFRSRIRARIKPILGELDEFQTHPDLPHEALALLDRYRSLKQVLSEEQIADD
jgi:hypothetical protein